MGQAKKKRQREKKQAAEALQQQTSVLPSNAPINASSTAPAVVTSGTCAVERHAQPLVGLLHRSGEWRSQILAVILLVLCYNVGRGVVGQFLEQNLPTEAIALICLCIALHRHFFFEKWYAFDWAEFGCERAVMYPVAAMFIGTGVFLYLASVNERMLKSPKGQILITTGFYAMTRNPQASCLTIYIVTTIYAVSISLPKCARPVH